MNTNNVVNKTEDAKPLNMFAANLAKLEEQAQKLEQAQNFLEDISDRLFWALDFGDCPEAVEPISRLVDAVSDSQDQLQKSQDQLEEILSEFKRKHNEALSELNQELTENLQLI